MAAPHETLLPTPEEIQELRRQHLRSLSDEDLAVTRKGLVRIRDTHPGYQGIEDAYEALVEEETRRGKA